MGNICRSPLAEGVFAHIARQSGLADRFKIDSSRYRRLASRQTAR
ncbi:arsenate reductase/protein-tyrosine-phosphatase family protein [Rhizobium yanglingense]